MNKGTEELHIRVNQWKEHIKEYQDSEIIEHEYYATDVEVRTMITDIILELDIDLDQLDKDLLFQIDSIDNDLRTHWVEGGFIWPNEWIPAYSKGDYWWLYGIPRTTENI